MMLVEDVAMTMVFKGLVLSVQKGCLLLIPLLLIIKTGLALLKGFTDPNVKVQYQPLLSGILIWVMIACYPEIMKYVDLLGQNIIGFVAPPVEDPVTAVSKAMYTRKALSGMNTANSWNEAVSEIAAGNVLQGSGKALGTASGSLIKSITETGEDWIAGLLSIFASVARMVIEMVRSMLLKFLIAVGPIAITFSLADGFNHVARFWFQKLLSVYCWALTLNILDHITISYYAEIALRPEINKILNQPVKVETPYFMDQLIVGGMYLMVPWLTSTYLGGMNAGQFLSNKINVISTLFTTAISSAKTLIAGKS